MGKSNRIVYLDHLRIFATFAVMILHISAQNWHSADVNGFEWQLFNAVDSAVRWCVPVFVMISGSLFLGKEIPVKAIYSKHILRLIVSFVIWSIIYSYFFIGSPEDKLLAAIKGHYHMWFILMMIGLYMSVPIIKTVIKDINTSVYFLILAFFTAFAIPELVTFVNDFGGTHMCEVVNVFKNDIFDRLQLHIIVGYTSYFIFGHFLNSIILNKRQRTVLYLLGLIGFASTVILNSTVAIKTQAACGHYYGNFTVNVLMEATAIFVWIKYRYCNTKISHTVIQNLSQYSYGAYLVHALILEQLNVHFGLNTMTFEPIFSIICISIIVFALSFSISAILNNIPLVKKYIV